MTDTATIAAQYVVEVQVSIQKSAGPETSPKEYDIKADAYDPAVEQIGNACAGAG